MTVTLGWWMVPFVVWTIAFSVSFIAHVRSKDWEVAKMALYSLAIGWAFMAAARWL